MTAAGKLWTAIRSGVERSGMSVGLSRQPKRLRSIDRLPLTAHCSLHLVQVDDRQVLIAVTKEGATMLETQGNPCRD